MLAARRTLATLAMALALAFSGGLIASATAVAASPEPTMGLTELQAKLEESPTNTLQGCFKTVMRGSKIETITCTVLSITGEASPDTALIMFKATDAAITDIGGIAEGMSGSPVYVNDGGVYKVVGALSYGNEFTIGGNGLATPIEAMLDIQRTYSPQIQPLSRPIMTSDGLIDRVIVAPNPEDFEGASHDGAFVARPLTAMFVGGLRSDSKVFQRLKAELAGKGIGVDAQPTPGTGTSSLDTPLVPGATVCSLASRGDLWIGSLGTVTYTDGEDVLAYGHPADWLGESDEFMTNGTIDGVWPSLQTPFKMGRPATLKGTITQDRTAGILGRLNDFPAETTITVHAVNTDTHKTANTAVYFPSSFVSEGLLGYWAFSAATYVAGAQLFDQQYVSGSAEETTTIVFADDTRTYEVVLPDRIDNYGQLPLMVTADTAMVVDALNEVGDFEIKSVDVQVQFSKKHTGADIISIDAPLGLQTGANRIVVQLLPTSDDDTLTVETTLTIPAGMPLGGVLFAASGRREYVDGDSVAGIYKDLSEWQGPDKLQFGYTTSGYGGGYYYEDEGDDYLDSVESSVGTPWVLGGHAMATVTRIITSAQTSIAYNRSTTVNGYVLASQYSLPATASVFVTDAGQTQERLLGTYKVYPMGSVGAFRFSTGPLKSNATIRIHTDGVAGRNEDYPGSTTANSVTRINVGAAVSLSSSARRIATGHTVKLTARVTPATAAGRLVAFQYYDSKRKRWRTIATKGLATSGGTATAMVKWKVLRGAHKVHARYLGGTMNAPSSSVSLVIRGS